MPTEHPHATWHENVRGRLKRLHCYDFSLSSIKRPRRYPFETSSSHAMLTFCHLPSYPGSKWDNIRNKMGGGTTPSSSSTNPPGTTPTPTSPSQTTTPSTRTTSNSTDIVDLRRTALVDSATRVLRLIQQLAQVGNPLRVEGGRLGQACIVEMTFRHRGWRNIVTAQCPLNHVACSCMELAEPNRG